MKSYETRPRKNMDEVEGSLVEVDATDDEETAGVGVIDDEIDAPGGEITDLDVMETPPMEIAPEQPPRRKWSISPPSREQILQWAPFWGVIILGAVLRFWGLGDKPLHHDESLHAYYSLQLLHNLETWGNCINPPYQGYTCYTYDPLLHGPFQFHLIAFVYWISHLFGAADNGVNTTTVRIGAATLGTLIVGLPYFLRDYLGKIGAWLACFLLAVSPSMVYFSRFAREDIYMACFTLLMVVAVARYIHDRKMRWLVIAAAAFSLSYATKEASFLTIGVFGSFLGGLIVWEIGKRCRLSSPEQKRTLATALVPRTLAPMLLLLYVVVAGIAAKILLRWLDYLAVYTTDPKTQPLSDAFVQGLKDKTVAIVPWIGILLGVYVLSILGREMFGKIVPQGRRGLAKRVNPKLQPVLDTIVTMPWTHWFFAVLVAWTIFLVLFTVEFTNIRGGIGDGIWAGLYYWIQQQQVARGGQPWYYYFLLIPLYEQIGVVFAVVGVIRALTKPNPFRLFMVYWFVGNVFIYSWAGEKMPWLMIHMTMPMMILAAIGLEPAVRTVIDMVKNRLARRKERAVSIPLSGANNGQLQAPPPRRKVGIVAGGAAVFGVVMAVLLLLPTVHNMYEVSYVHAADGPHEMMVYVQTTTDINIVMARVDELDQKYYGGNHQMPIALTYDATWPFAWYVRDYPNICFNYPTGCPNWPKNTPVIIGGGDNPYALESQYSGQNGQYVFHQYHMRSWWDEGYKPPPCVPTSANNNCAGQQTYGGVGPGLWLSYGDTPPPGAKFNLGLAAQNIWQWWWNRKAIGSTDGAYDMVLFIHKGLDVAP
ncbi:MAG TPA: flippase activity-associated protein Agl23 [Ktedonobacteraceae bacterium]|nr:flippase activity-associated protein Agl23 [Ktedonobacteraceae bacterium]